MQKALKSVFATSTLLSTLLIATGTAGAQTDSELCNGLEPTIIGTEGDDVLTGTFAVDVIVGLGGNDVIHGHSGADVICGGDGNDVIYGHSQDDTIFGGSGDDELYGGSDRDLIDGGPGNDALFGDSQNDVLFGGAGDDNLNGGSDSDDLDGGPGFDTLNGLWQVDSCANGEVTLNCETETQTESAETLAPILLSSSDVAWIQGSSAWVNLMWTGDADFANLRVQASSSSDGVAIEYPGDGSATSSNLNTDADLSTAEIDFTALKFTTSTPGVKHVSLNVSWINGAGEEESANYNLELSNVAYEGDDFAILTTEAAVGTDAGNPAANWIDLGYLGLAPTNRDMVMTVDSDLPVYYPQETFTSLHHDEILHAGETDVSRIWFDPELIESGEGVLTVMINYVDSTGTAKSVTHEVTLTVR